MRVMGLLLVFGGGIAIYWAYINGSGVPYGKNAGQDNKPKGLKASDVGLPEISFLSPDASSLTPTHLEPGPIPQYFKGVSDWVRNHPTPGGLRSPY